MSGLSDPGGDQQTVPVDVSSSTTLAIDVDKTTARPAVAEGTGTDSTATVERSGTQLERRTHSRPVSAR